MTSARTKNRQRRHARYRLVKRVRHYLLCSYLQTVKASDALSEVCTSIAGESSLRVHVLEFRQKHFTELATMRIARRDWPLWEVASALGYLRIPQASQG